MKRKLQSLMSVVIILIYLATDLYKCYGEDISHIYNKEENLIEAYEINKNIGDISMDGKVNIVKEIEKLHQGIYFGLGTDTEKYETLYRQDEVINIDNSIYSADNIQINANNIQLKGIMVAENNIKFSATNIESTDFTILYSKKGNINIDFNLQYFKGIIYAPNGTVTINGTEANVDGYIYAEKVNIATSKYNMYASIESKCYLESIKKIRNDNILTLRGNYIDGKGLEILSSSNSVILSEDIYIRYNDANEFEIYQKIEGTEIVINEFEGLYTFDIIIVGYSEYGEIIESNILSYEINDNELQEIVIDSDKDGLSDGFEIWYSKTDRNKFDTDQDGASDGEEILILYTDPLVYTKFGDSDLDGINDLEEVQLNTQPFYKDSDFDGIDDKNDKEPLKYNYDSQNTNMPIAINYKLNKYDLVLTSCEDNGIVQYIYDTLNQVIKYRITQYQQTAYGYKNKNLIFEIGQGQNDYVRTYLYDEFNDIISIGQNGYRYDFVYNDEQVLKSIKINDKLLVEYENNENQQNILYGNQSKISEIYENNNKTIKLNENVAFLFNYDNNGLLKEIVNSIDNQSEYYEYTEYGAYQSILDTRNYNIKYEYFDNMFDVYYSINSKNKYQELENGYTKKDEEMIHNMVLVSGDLLQTQIGNADNYNFSIYSPDKKLIVKKEYNLKDKKIENLSYGNVKYRNEYDNQGRLIKEFIDNECRYEYKYNELGNVIQYYNNNDNIIYNYEYDGYGNILSETIYDQNIENNIENNRYVYSNEWKDQLIEFNDSAITYDVIGNPVSYLDKGSMEWEGRQLKTITNNNNKVVYKYNSEGIRIQKIINNKITNYFLEGKDIIAEETDGQITWYIYDAYGEVIGFIYNDENYYYQKNSRSDVVSVLNEEGETICTYEYDIYGKVQKILGNKVIAEINKFRYKSYYYDNETDFYYLESRYYDSETGRFINVDNSMVLVYSKNNLNLYAYCSGDPVNYMDSEGNVRVAIAYDGKDFANETEDIAREFYNYFGTKVTIKNFDTTNVKSGTDGNVFRKNFKEWWNNNANNYNIITLFGHGNYNTIFVCANNDGITSNYVQENLNKTSTNLLILIACNAGHYSYRFNNVAYAFAKKVRLVVASDGTIWVTRHTPFLSYYSTETFATVNDETWKKYNIDGRKNNYGWVIYRNTGSNIWVYTTTLSKQQINIIDIYKYVKNVGFYK